MISKRSLAINSDYIPTTSNVVILIRVCERVLLHCFTIQDVSCPHQFIPVKETCFACFASTPKRCRALQRSNGIRLNSAPRQAALSRNAPRRPPMKGRGAEDCTPGLNTVCICTSKHVKAPRLHFFTRSRSNVLSNFFCKA